MLVINSYMINKNKVEFDYEYLKEKLFLLDLKILWLTFYKVIKNDRVSH